MYRDNESIIVNRINNDSEARETNDFISKYDCDVVIAGLSTSQSIKKQFLLKRHQYI